MTDRDRIYSAACALPPSVERDVILEACVRSYRQDRLGTTVRRQLALDHYRDVLRMLEDESPRYPRPDQMPALRESHATVMA